MKYAAGEIGTDVDPAWDALVERTPGGDLTQTTRWAASRRQLGFRCYRMAVTQSDQKLLGCYTPSGSRRAYCLDPSRAVLSCSWIAPFLPRR